MSSKSLDYGKVWKEVKLGSQTFVHLNLDGLVERVSHDDFSDKQRWTMELLNSFRTQILVGLLISINMVCLVIETNAISLTDSRPVWLVVANRALLGVFLVEMTLRLFAYSLFFFKSPFNLVDFMAIFSDVIVEVITAFTGDHGLNLTVFRMLRIARLARGYRVMRALPMLSGMVHDLIGAFEAVVWGCFLLMIFITIWSILCVQIIHPIIEELARDTDVFEGCERCPRAFSTVWHAQITLFQAVVAGDSWGVIAIPVMEHYWWTFVFFMGTVFTLHLMLMNVILAAVVSKAEETRKQDLHEMMRHKEAHFVAQSKKLMKVCENLDDNDSGDLTIQELLEGWESNPVFAATFHDMGIEKDDLKTMFMIMDSDRSGAIDYKEFVQHIHRMKTSDTTTLLNFIRHYVLEILRQTNRVAAAMSVAGADCDNTNSCSKQCVDPTVALFEESQRVPAPRNDVVKEVTIQQFETYTPIRPNDQDAANLIRAIEGMVSVSDVHLNLLQSIDKSINTLVANIDAKHVPPSQVERQTHVASAGESETKREIQTTANPISNCCLPYRNDKERLVIRPGQERQK